MSILLNKFFDKIFGYLFKKYEITLQNKRKEKLMKLNNCFNKNKQNIYQEYKNTVMKVKV